jgi:phosphoserine phosphatase
VSERLGHVLNVTGNGAATLARSLSHLGTAVWLRDGYAFDIPLTGDVDTVVAQARASATDADLNIIPAANRRKKLLIADMDSTIINCEVVDELADFARIKDKVAAITERAVNGEIEFAAAVRERVALLKGLALDRVRRVYGERIRLNPGAKALVATMRAHGAYTMLVSGGFTWFTERVAADAGFDFHLGNTLIDDGIALTGAVGEPVLGREAKLDALREGAAQRGLPMADTLAVGDGANDLDMIRAAGLGVAYHAKPIVAAAAHASIAHGDLTALLYLQGYREAEIVRP